MPSTNCGALFPACSLNAIILDATELIAVHANAESALAYDVIKGFEKFHFPEEHADDYCGLRWATHSDGTMLVGSTGVAEADWLPIPIQLGDGSASLAPMAGAPSERCRLPSAPMSPRSGSDPRVALTPMGIDPGGTIPVWRL